MGQLFTLKARMGIAFVLMFLVTFAFIFVLSVLASFLFNGGLFPSFDLGALFSFDSEADMWTALYSGIES
jgi:NADH:ubiquinone oxidoreductase subunit H